MLLSADEPVSSVFVVADGSARVFGRLAGQNVTSALVHRGGCFGLAGLVSSTRSSLSPPPSHRLPHTADASQAHPRLPAQPRPDPHCGRADRTGGWGGAVRGGWKRWRRTGARWWRCRGGTCWRCWTCFPKCTAASTGSPSSSASSPASRDPARPPAGCTGRSGACYGGQCRQGNLNHCILAQDTV